MPKAALHALQNDAQYVQILLKIPKISTILSNSLKFAPLHFYYLRYSKTTARIFHIFHISENLTVSALKWAQKLFSTPFRSEDGRGFVETCRRRFWDKITQKWAIEFYNFQKFRNLQSVFFKLRHVLFNYFKAFTKYEQLKKKTKKGSEKPVLWSRRCFKARKAS